MIDSAPLSPKMSGGSINVRVACLRIQLGHSGKQMSGLCYLICRASSTTNGMVRYGNIRNRGLCANLLLGGVQNTVGNIMRLASNISRLAGIAKLGKKTRENLRNVAQCRDTILDLELLSCFAEGGFLVTPYPVLDSGTTPDAKAEVDKTDIFIEITHMEWPKREDFPGFNWKSKQGGKLIEMLTGRTRRSYTVVAIVGTCPLAIKLTRRS